jgi:hypothetical protein
MDTKTLTEHVVEIHEIVAAQTQVLADTKTDVIELKNHLAKFFGNHLECKEHTSEKIYRLKSRVDRLYWGIALFIGVATILATLYETFKH